MSIVRRILCAAACLVIWDAQGASAKHVLDNGRIRAILADTSAGLTGTNADRVDSITWINSDGVTTANVASNGGPLHCNDPQEFFGQSYGDSGSARPFFVIAGDKSTWTALAGSRLTGTSNVTTLKTCETMLDGTTRTQYLLTRKPNGISQLRIVRTFMFSTTETSGTLRAYVPRLRFTPFHLVLIPDAKGTVQTVDAGACPGGCEVANWNGSWFADDDGSGNGLMVLRNPTTNPAAVVVVDNDSFSASNNTSVGLRQPASGWSGAVRETEALCFYDAKSWPATRRAAGLPPKGCHTP